MMCTFVAPAGRALFAGTFLTFQSPTTQLALGGPAGFGTLERAARMEAVEHVLWRYRGGASDPRGNLSADGTVTDSLEMTAEGCSAAASTTLWVPQVSDVNLDGLRSDGDPVFLTWTIFGLPAPTSADVKGGGFMDAHDLATRIAHAAGGWS